MLKRRYSAREAQELFAYFAIEPFNDISNHWLPIAQLTATYINAHQEKGKTPVSVRDLIPMLQMDDEDMDPDPEPEEDEGL